MTLEKIEVRYSIISDIGVGIPQGGYYHKYIVYTDKDGNEYAARGGHNLGFDRGFGEIVTEVGPFQDDIFDEDGNLIEEGFTDFPDPGETDPSEIIHFGRDLSDVWGDIVDAMNDIEREGHNYSPIGKNSNATVDEALKRAGLPEPEYDDYPNSNDPINFWSPGSGTDLPEGVMPDYDDILPTFINPLIPSWLSPANGLRGDRPSWGPSPLVLDLDGSGSVDLISLEDSSAFFDFHGDDAAKRIGWAAPGDAFLTHDIDGNGQIDSVFEMFGSPYGLAYIFSTFHLDFEENNGFAALEVHDSNADGVIDALDNVWSELSIWRDLNSDGVTDDRELITLDAAGIESFDLIGVSRVSTGTPLNGGPANVAVDIEGHYISHGSTFKTTDGEEREIVDAWFDTDLINTQFDGEYTLDIRTLFLPTARGYGQLPDLHVAMSLDNGAGGLLEQVQNFAVARDFTAMFSDYAKVRDEVEALLYHWAGIEATNGVIDEPDFGDNGGYSLLPEYHFVRTFMGQNTDYIGAWLDLTGFMPNNADAFQAITDTFDNLLDAFAARLVFQSGGQALFEEGASYNPFADVFVGELALSQTAIDALRDEAALHADQTGFWNAVARFIDNIQGVDALSPDELVMLQAAVANSTGGALDWAGVVATLSDVIVDAPDGGAVIHGSDLNTVFTGGDGADTLIGGDGNDVFNGFSNGGPAGVSDDVYVGGKGNDHYFDGYGNDIFQYDWGHDLVSVFSGGSDYKDTTDIIRFGKGIRSEDVSYHYTQVTNNSPNGPFDILSVAGRGTINLIDWTGSSPDKYSLIDELHFENGEVVQFADLSAMFHSDRHGSNISAGSFFTGEVTLYGNEGDDHLSLYQSVSSDAWLYGGAGDDVLSSRDNAAHLFGGAGDDTYLLGTANERVYFESGDDLLAGTQNSHNRSAGAGYETIILPENVSREDLTFWRTQVRGSNSFENLKIEVSDLGSISIHNQFLGVWYSVVETLEFSDGSTLNLEDLSYVTLGTSGDDTFSSGYGWPNSDDVYRVMGGRDTINDSRGNDTIVFEDGIEFEDLTIFKDGFFQHWSGRLGNDELYIGYGEGDLIEIRNYELTTRFGEDHAIEKLRFSSGEEVYLSEIEISVRGGAESDNLSGVGKDASPDDTIYGFGGADSLFGGTGDDFLIGGLGSDHLDGGAGNDTAVYSGAFQNYRISTEGRVTYVDDLVGAEGRDNLREVEVLNFSDGSFDIERGSFTAINTVGRPVKVDDFGGIAVFSSLDANELGAVFETLDDALAITEDGALVRISSTASNALSDLQNAEITTNGLTIETSSGLNANLTLQAGVQDITLAGQARFNVNAVSGANSIVGGSGNDSIDGGSGNDTLIGGAGNDTIFGAEGSDIIKDGVGADTVFGGDGADEIELADGDDLVYAGEHSDKVVILGSGSKEIHLEGGNDRVTLSSVLSQSIFGGEGTDRIEIESLDHLEFIQTSAQSRSGVIHNEKTGAEILVSGIEFFRDAINDQTFTFERLFKQEITGTIFDDTLNGGSGVVKVDGLGGDDLLIGHSKNDVLLGNDGDDRLQGFLGRDRLDGGFGNDRLIGGGDDDWLYGGANNDLLIGGAGDDLLNGSFGRDSAAFYGSIGVRVNLTRTSAQDTGQGRDRLIGIEDLKGSSADDVLIGNNRSNQLVGLEGDDLLNGLNGADHLIGHHGDDVLYGGFGVDRLFGGDGDDRLIGGGAKDYLYGHGGNDLLRGDDGNDTLKGGAGNDRLFGGGHNDTLIGDGGNDHLYGGLGRDSFIFSANTGTDRVKDFVHGEDRFVINGGANAFQELEITQRGDDVLIRLAEGTIIVENTEVNDLTARDFFFQPGYPI